jgi:hypothetical protein
MQLSRASFVLQKEQSRQPVFFVLWFPFFRCSIHCSGSSTTLQVALS